MCACVYVCVSLGVMCQRCTSRCPLRSTSAYVASVFAMLCDTGLYRIVQGGTSVGWVQGGLMRSCLVGVAYTSTTICNKGVLVPLVCRDMSCGDTSLMSLFFSCFVSAPVTQGVSRVVHRVAISCFPWCCVRGTSLRVASSPWLESSVVDTVTCRDKIVTVVVRLS